MPTTDFRISLAIPKELENEIYDMRIKEEFRRLSLSEIMRRLIEAGIKAYKQEG